MNFVTDERKFIINLKWSPEDYDKKFIWYVM